MQRALNALLSLALLGSSSNAAFAGIPEVRVNTVEELVAAVATPGPARILIDPGSYVFEAALAVTDKELVATGAGVTFEIGAGFEFPPPFQVLECSGVPTGLGGSGAFIRVSGAVMIEGIAFTGLRPPLGSYVGSAPDPCSDGVGPHSITIRGCSFVSDDWVIFGPSANLGNVHACASSCIAPTSTVVFEDNYVQGALFGVIIGNSASDAPGARVDASVARNEFRVPYTTILLYGSGAGSGGTLVGQSSDNVVHDSWGYGLWIAGGLDLFGPGGSSYGRVEWTSNRDRFVNNYVGMGLNGGHRHADWDGPDFGNQARVSVVDPRFEGCWRDMEILGSSTYEPLRANQGEKHLPGNRVEVSLAGATFTPGPGTVFIRNHMSDENGLRYSEPLPPARVNMPAYGNQATLTGTLDDFLRLNPGVSPVPDDYFSGSAD